MKRSMTTRNASFFIALACLTGCPALPGADESATDGIMLDSASDTSGGPSSTAGLTGTSTSVGTSEGEASSASTTGEDPTTGEASSSTTGSESTDYECEVDGDCEDDSFCNGAERCVEHECVGGDPVECTSTVDCVTLECDDLEGACVATLHHDSCGCGETCDEQLGCGIHCTPAICSGDTPYQCGDCIDNDGDCRVDAMDLDCWGPCSNNESGWNGDVPGQQNQSECNVMDCYFDANSGAGNDGCYWSHTCDPLQPTWHDDACTYDVEYSPPGAGDQDCGALGATQSDVCESICGPLTPNGCDCFGCCELTLGDGSSTTVYLASTDDNGAYTCSAATAGDPDLCHPCTQVPACLNPCDGCELCLGQDELPEECTEQECPNGFQACGLIGQDPCPELQACITGCCVPQPQ